MKQKKIALILILTIALGCAGLGAKENLIRVRGELVILEGAPDECFLGLSRSGEEFNFRSLPIAGEFESTLTVSPRPGWYYVTVYCEAVGEVIRSSPFRVAGLEYFYAPIELGQLIVGKKRVD